MNYSEYLFCCLLKLYAKTFEGLEYDSQYKLGMLQYKDFENSRFNVNAKSEYECIINYLEDEYGKQ